MGSVIGYQEAHGPVVTFETDVAGKIKKIEASIEPVQDLHGYDHPWPAGGGKNLLPNNAVTETINGISFTVNNDGTVRVNGTASDEANLFIYSQLILQSGNYILNGCPTGGSTSTYRIFATNIGSDVGNGISFTTNGSMSTTIRINIKSGIAINNLVFKPMIRLATESDATFTPYSNICPITGWTGANITVNSNVITITFPSEAGTVYGGTLDIISGQLTVNKTIIDLGTLEWEKSNLTYFKSHSLKGLVATPIDQKTSADIICSKYQTLSYSQVYVGNINGIAVIGDTSENDIGLLTINDLTLINNTPEEFKASLSGTMLVYKVKSPVSYTLTPQEINTIIGANNIYANTGDTSVYYPITIEPVEGVSNVNLMELRRGIIASQPHLETKSGGIVSFKSTMARKPKSLVVDIEPVQEGSGDPSPDNIRLITGWTGANVTKRGKNLLDDKKYQYTATQVRIGTDGSSDYNYIPRGIYTLSVTANVDTTVYYRIEGADAIRIGMNGGTFELEQDALVCFYCYRSGSLSVDDITQWQLELGSTATVYEPYQGSTYDITFQSAAGTVYGGTLDVVKGELVVDRVMVSVNSNNGKLNTNGKTAITTKAFFRPFVEKMPGTTEFISDKFFIVGTDKIGSMTGRTTSGGVEFSLPHDVPDTGEGVNEWFNTNPTQLVYKLATPITYQLTPQEIALLPGNNTIYADCGDTTISYFTN